MLRSPSRFHNERFKNLYLIITVREKYCRKLFVLKKIENFDASSIHARA